jgi:hypothetical protein
MFKKWAETAVITFVFILIALIIWPTFAAGLPCSDDNLTHIYRVMQIDLNRQQGAFLLHWSPDMLRGYGYPVLGFYAPLSYWLVEGIYLLNGDLAAAMRLALFGSLILAGGGTYLLARRYVGPTGALVAGLGFMFAPYLLYDAIQRGSLPETLALALIPWALALLDISQQRRSGPWLVVTGLTFVLLILSHNVVPFLGLGLAVLWAILPNWDRLAGWGDRRDLLAQLWPTVTILLLALGLTLFFWLPGLAELGDTQSRRPDPPLVGWPRFEQHILPTAELITWPDEPADPALLNPPLTRTLGLGLALVGLLGVLALAAYPSGRRRQQLVVVAGLTAVSLFFTLPHSHWWWENVDALRFIHLPTRFLGPASLGLALLGGVAVDRLFQAKRERRLAPLGFLLAGIVVTMSGWPWLYPHHCPAPAEVDRLDLATVTTWPRWFPEAQAELLPRWVDEMPPENFLTPQYEAGGPINRLILPPVVAQLEWETAPGRDWYRLAATTAVSLTYHTFYFPGWQIMVNDTAVGPLITSPHGLMALELPPGEHEVEIAFRATPIRRAGLAISLLLLLPTVALLFYGKGREERRETSLRSPPILRLALCLLLALVLLGLKAGVDRWQTPLRADRFQAGQLRGVGQPLAIDFGSEFTYLGFEAPQQASPERPFTITQYWAPQREIGVPYGFGLYVADDAGQTWQQALARPFTYTDYPGELGWRVGMYARDAYEMRLLPGTPPGVYWLEAEAFRRDVAGSLLPRDWPTGPNPARARVGQIEVTAVSTTDNLDHLTAATAHVSHFEPQPVADGLTLAGWSLADFPLRSGDRMPLTLLWHGSLDGNHYSVIGERYLVVLRDENDVVVGELVRPVGGDYRLVAWPARALVREQIGWRVAPALATGSYTIWLQGKTAEPIRLGEVTINAPERLLVAPETAVTLDDATLDFAQLAGYTLTGQFAPGQTLTLDLVWRALAETETGYRVFVHLRSSSEGIVAQSDSEPQSWLRPTTGWLPGEFISDRHEIHLPDVLPADYYSLFVGLYDPASGLALDEVELLFEQGR